MSSTYIIGHRNPDTDSVCSAICYANLKNILEQKNSTEGASKEFYVAKRAGHMNEETQYVLNRWGVLAPEYIKDVRPQVKDVEYHVVEGAHKDISIREAWNLMKKSNTVTLPILEQDEMIGLISLGDITKSYFEIYETDILAKADTPFKNIVSTVEGTVLTEEEPIARINSGKTVIAADNPEMMEEYIEPGDIVILGNRYEAQLCAIEMNACCIIVCEADRVSKTILKLASQQGCAVVTTAYDTYTVARLINQSMPISFYMTPREKIVRFSTEDYIEDIQDIMAKKRFRDFPILTPEGKYLGTISRRNLIKHGRKKLILVDHNEKSQAISGVETTDILEIIDHHRISAIETMSPVYFRNQPLGCTATIIYQMYCENSITPDVTTAALLCSAILSDTLILKSPTCTARDVEACEILAGIAGIDIEEYGREIFKAGSNLGDKTPEEIFKRDFKRFTINDVNIGVGQVNCMDEEEILEVRQKLDGYLSRVTSDAGIEMAYIMLTNVIEESSWILCAGNNAVSTLCNGFNVTADGSCVYLRGVVSRKKQLLPTIFEALQN